MNKQSSKSGQGRKPVIVVIGGQWGSEAKGMVAAALCKERQVDIAVRTGTVNAGHTVYVGDVPFKMQQLPTSWATVPATIVLGAGAYINPKILLREIELIDSSAVPYHDAVRIIIDNNAGLHIDDHTERSTLSGRHHSMGATGKGCSEAVIDKIRLRGSGKTTLFRQWWNEHRVELGDLVSRVEFTDVSKYLYDEYQAGKQILIEGTQGSHLDLHLGPYPYTTHKQTQAAQWIQEAGLGVGNGPAGVEFEIVMVVRTYPIRVAGNSGPMPWETSWVNLALKINSRLADLGLPLREPTVSDLNYWEEVVAECARKYRLNGREALDMHRWTAEQRIINKVALSELHRDAFNLCPGPVQVRLKSLFEFTTVTQKLRRVAEWNPEVVRQAIRWNGPNTVVLSFFNYWYPELWNATSRFNGHTKEYRDRVWAIEDEIGQAIQYVTTGSKTEHMIKATRPED